MKLTFISDTHTKHSQLNLNGGDVLIHSGDFMNSGYVRNNIMDFLDWFVEQPYKQKIFISGNHDRYFQNNTEEVRDILDSIYGGLVSYLEDDGTNIGDVNVWGSPWQPEFFNWAYNLPRQGTELKEKWDMIPENTDILITHGPPHGYLDKLPNIPDNLGCELLRERVDIIKPKIHVFGHIHYGYGYVTNGDTHFINAAVLNEQYIHEHKPINVEWNPETNDLDFV
jgi:Icc-related predicted phosphoesterase